MRRHIFLTGEKQAGKSTLLRKLIPSEVRTLGGFFTVRTGEVFPDAFSVHLLHADGRDRPAKENLLFLCDDLAAGRGGFAKRFDLLGCAVLEQSKGSALILMDELGPAEADAFLFQRAVRAALDGETPVLGVLQRAQTDFLESIGRHPDVALIEVTRENRDRLAERLAGEIRRRIT